MLPHAGMVEAWLQRLVEGMQGTMKTLIRRAARSVNEMGLQDFMFGHPAQIALLGLQFQWTADTQARCIRDLHRCLSHIHCDSHTHILCTFVFLQAHTLTKARGE